MFEKLIEVNPNPILDVLIENDYKSIIIPTSQELKDLIKKAKKRTKSKEDDYIGDEEDSLLEGIIIGGVLF